MSDAIAALVAIDPAQIAHEFLGAAIGIAEMMRCAKQLKLKAGAVREDWAGDATSAEAGVSELDTAEKTSGDAATFMSAPVQAEPSRWAVIRNPSLKPPPLASINDR